MFVLRKVYILPLEHPEDDRVIDALAAAGIVAEHEGDLENPTCPVCGGNTLLACAEGTSFDVLTWYCLEDDDWTTADTWFLVCLNPECDWEEPVEQTQDPMNAIIFDMEAAHYLLDEELGLIEGNPAHQRDLAEYFRGLLAERPNRKVQSYLEEAEWRYEEGMKEVRGWMERIPSGRRIEFSLGDQQITAKFLTAAGDSLLVLKEPDDELLAVQAEAIGYFTPRTFDQPEPEPESEEEYAERILRYNRTPIMFSGRHDRVVIRGFHLWLNSMDRLGQFHAYTDDPVAGLALGMTSTGAKWWQGRFRRADIEARYKEHELLLVAGYWVEKHGESTNGQVAGIITKDPEVAAALGLEPQYALYPPEVPREQRELVHYYGVIPADLPEARRIERVYLWPQTSDSQAK